MWCQRELGKQAEGAGWRLGLALRCPHPEEHCVITEMWHQSFQRLPQTLPRQPQLPPGLGGWGTWYDPHAMLLGGGESSSKLLENIRLWGPSGGKGLPGENNLIFGQRETVDGVQVPIFETSLGPKRKDAAVPCAWVASWEKRQVSM